MSIIMKAATIESTIAMLFLLLLVLLKFIFSIIFE